MGKNIQYTIDSESVNSGLRNILSPPWTYWDAALLLQLSYILIWTLTDETILAWMFLPISFLAILFVPGATILKQIKSVTLGRAEFATMSLGLSLFYIILLGVLVNTVGTSVGIARPLSPTNLFYANSILITGMLIVGKHNAGEFQDSIELNINRRYAVLILPVIALIGGHILRQYGENLFLILVYLAICLIPLLCILVFEKEWYSVAIFSASLTLVWGTSVMIPFLNPAADAANEYMISQTVNSIGFWSPTLNVDRVGNLRLLFGQPVMTNLLNLEMMWSFKFVHPTIVSVLPVAVYKLYSRFWDEEISLLGALFYMFIYTFFVIFPQNTRTSSAVLFMTLSLLTLAIISQENTSNRFAILVPILFSGCIFSHYGTGYLLLLGMLSSLVFTLFLSKVGGYVPRFKQTNPRFISLENVMFSVVFGLAFYTFVWNGKITALSNAIYGVIDTVTTTEVVSSGSRATYTTTESFRSESLNILRTLYILLSLIAAVGGLLMAVDRLMGKSHPPDSFLGFQAWMGIILVISFTPVAETYGIFRIYPITMVVLAICLPYGFKRAHGMFARTSLGIKPNHLYQLCSVLLAVFLVFNSGLSGAVVYHDRTPNIELDRHYLAENGNDAELYSLYTRLQVEEDLEATDWLLRHRSEENNIYSDMLPGRLLSQYHTKHYVMDGDSNLHPPSSLTISDISDIRPGSYLFIGEYNHKSNVITSPGETYIKQYSTVNKIPIDKIENNFQNSVYTSGTSNVRTNTIGNVPSSAQERNSLNNSTD